jgi:hypothetical protein
MIYIKSPFFYHCLFSYWSGCLCYSSKLTVTHMWASLVVNLSQMLRNAQIQVSWILPHLGCLLIFLYRIDIGYPIKFGRVSRRRTTPSRTPSCCFYRLRVFNHEKSPQITILIKSHNTALHFSSIETDILTILSDDKLKNNNLFFLSLSITDYFFSIPLSWILSVSY